jgi:hypothetical protein
MGKSICVYANSTGLLAEVGFAMKSGKPYLNVSRETGQARWNLRQILITASPFVEEFVLALNRRDRLDEDKNRQGRVPRFTPHRADTQKAFMGRPRRADE